MREESVGEAIASCFSLPLYRIDMIEVFSGRHGNADRAFVEACRIVEAVAPAVVWFDEIEMGLTAQTGEASHDLGRIFAFFLTWMQEKARGCSSRQPQTASICCRRR